MIWAKKIIKSKTNYSELVPVRADRQRVSQDAREIQTNTGNMMVRGTACTIE
jgi:hypothetical protein